MPSAQCNPHKNSVLISVRLLKRPPERKAFKKYWKKPVKKLSLFEQAEGKAGSELGKV